MEDFEKLGAFYLGKVCDPDAGEVRDELVLYDSRDLTTHAMIVGMTGSGKTGLGIGLLEEAAIDHVPVIAVDPKGDLTNLLLTFPDLRPEDFAPWINPLEAAADGRTLEEEAATKAALWKKGLAEWGQGGARVAKLREAAEFAVYTPGSSAGIPVSLLRSFQAPPAALREDAELFGERIEAAVTGLLTLLDIAADPLTSQEHILLANILEKSWRAGRDLDLPGLIGAIQQPPLERIGVFDLESFYPAKERFALAMRLNNLLASPGFAAWLEGEPLDAGRLFYAPSGRPRVSVISIAHLTESERMFFVTLLLGELLGWMRAQAGTTSLRAIFYMDEIFGYLPPVANPPSKRPLLTLLKQARAFGLGLVLATQNPVDLDYKGLSNIGTWFIGRLQTERDKARLVEGLQSAAGGGDRSALEQLLSSLGKRRFLLHNVHEDQPVVFHTRWALSYLAGPLTREQIQTLTAGRAAEPRAPGAEASADSPPAAALQEKPAAEGPPPVPPGISQFFLPAGALARFVYLPRLLGVAEVRLQNAAYQVDASERVACICLLEDGPIPVDWKQAEPLDLPLDALAKQPVAGAAFAPCPAAALQARNYRDWEALLTRWLRDERALTLWRSPTFKQVSAPGESQGDYRIRLQQLASERRDEAVLKLRKKYVTRTNTLEDRLLRAEQALEREREQSRKSKLETAISFGTALLGAFLGRKKASVGTASRVGTAVRSAGSIGKEAADVERAEETLARVRQKLAELEEAFATEVERLEGAFDAQQEALEEVIIRPRASDVHVQLVGLAWVPREIPG